LKGMAGDWSVSGAMLVPDREGSHESLAIDRDIFILVGLVAARLTFIYSGNQRERLQTHEHTIMRPYPRHPL